MGTKTGVLNRLMRYFADQGMRASPRLMGRVERIVEDNPDVLRVLHPQAVHESLTTGRPVAIIDPKNFEGRLAFPFEQYERNDPRYLQGRINDLAKVVVEGGGFNDMPFLDLYPGWAPAAGADMEMPALHVMGHEGRHRNKVLESLGYPESLIRLNPYDIRGQTDKYTLEDMTHALNQRSPVFGEDPTPENIWAGGEDFPFLRWYRRGGYVNGRPFGEGDLK